MQTEPWKRELFRGMPAEGIPANAPSAGYKLSLGQADRYLFVTQKTNFCGKIRLIKYIN